MEELVVASTTKLNRFATLWLDGADDQLAETPDFDPDSPIDVVLIASARQIQCFADWVAAETGIDTAAAWARYLLARTAQNEGVQ